MIEGMKEAQEACALCQLGREAIPVIAALVMELKRRGFSDEDCRGFCGRFAVGMSVCLTTPEGNDFMRRSLEEDRNLHDTLERTLISANAARWELGAEEGRIVAESEEDEIKLRKFIDAQRKEARP